MDRRRTAIRDHEGCHLKGCGISYGAFSILNGALCGIGASAGVGLATVAEFTVEGECTIVESDVDKEIPRICVEHVLQHISTESDGWMLNISSEIPSSNGMKSSSSLCNAIVESIFKAYSVEFDGMDVIRLGVDCARHAGITVTGAFDDACACHLGGIHVTDNSKDEIVRSENISEYDVLFHIPDGGRRKMTEMSADIRQSSMRNVSLAESDIFAAMTENGRIMAYLTGSDNRVAESAIEHGALGAGMTGFGPAVAMVFEKNDSAEFLRNTDIEVIRTRTRPIS